MIYAVYNYSTNKPTYFDPATNPNALADAEALLLTYRAEALTLPNIAQQFTILRVIQIDGGEKWEPANLDTDPEDGDYQVFDYHTGQYTFYDFKSEAVSAMNALKQQWLVECNLDHVTELPGYPPKPPAAND
jgi:hypothetical protein